MTTRARGRGNVSRDEDVDAAVYNPKRDRQQFTLVDPDGNETTTGDPGMINSLLVNGYRLKDATQEDVAEAQAVDQGGEATP